MHVWGTLQEAYFSFMLNVSNFEQFESAPLTCTHHSHAEVLIGKDSDGNYRTAPAKMYPEGLCRALASVAAGQFLAVAHRAPPRAPCLEEFAESVLAKFYIPSDPYLQTANSFGADCSTHTGTYSTLLPLPNGKAEIAAQALVDAKAASESAMTHLFGLPNGSSFPDKYGYPRLRLRP